MEAEVFMSHQKKPVAIGVISAAFCSGVLVALFIPDCLLLVALAGLTLLLALLYIRC